jgi:alpha-N-arabinofuranosidase
MYGDWQVGALSAEEYVKEASRWARAIRMIDPNAKLVSCGMNGWNDWDRVVIDGLASLVDYHSLHIYTGSEDYWTNVLAPHQAERAIDCARTLLKRAAYRQRLAAPPRIAYDEWNVWYREMTGALAERYDFTDALAVATYLNIFVRNCDWVQIANLAQMVNAIAPIVTSPDTAAVQPIWYPVLMHAQAALDTAVDVHVTGPMVGAELSAGPSRWPHRVTDLGPFTLIDAAATVSAHTTEERDQDVSAHNEAGGGGQGDGADRVSVTVVNRSPDEPETVEVIVRDRRFDGEASIRRVTECRSDNARMLAEVEPATVEHWSVPVTSGVLTLTLPPRSFTVIEAALARI